MDHVYEEEKFKLKDKVTIDQAKKLADTHFVGYLKACRLYNLVDENVFDGELFIYSKDAKPLFTAPVRIHTNWEIEKKRFFEDYEGKIVHFGREYKPVRAVTYWQEENEGAFVFYVNQIFNMHDWQNELALRALENDMLQPDDF